jgi:hypothetical protein
LLWIHLFDFFSTATQTNIITCQNAQLILEAGLYPGGAVEILPLSGHCSGFESTVHSHGYDMTGSRFGKKSMISCIHTAHLPHSPGSTIILYWNLSPWRHTPITRAVTMHSFIQKIRQPTESCVNLISQWTQLCFLKHCAF